MFTASKRSVTVLLAVLLVLAALPGTVLAQEATPSAGGVIVVEAGETLTGDQVLAAGTVLVEGTVDGDLIVLGGSVTVAEGGVVTGDLTATAGSVVVDGTVAGDLTAAAGSLVVGAGATVGSVEAGVGEARIAGTVAGDARIGADRIVLADGAVVRGDLTHDRETTVERAAGAQIEGDVVAAELGGAALDGFGVPAWLGATYALLANLVLGVALLLVAPALGRRVAGVGTRRAVQSGGVGLLALVGVPVALALIAVTIVGIPFSLAGFLAYALALWVGFVFGAFVLGTWLLGLADVESPYSRWLSLVVGLLVVTVLGLLPLVGFLAEFLVLLVGLGAFLLALRGRDGSEAETAAEPAGTGGSAT